MISYITCSSCGERIAELADDIVLTRRDGTAKHFFHTRCYDAAEETVLRNGLLRVWTITYRPAFEEDAA
jgi:hypothetical protein